MKNRQKVLSKEALFEQEEYIERIHRINEDRINSGEKAKTYYCVTYGCQMNEHDTEQIEYMLQAMGYNKNLIETEADIIVYNTCAVRENAELKVYGNIGHLKAVKEKNPEKKVIICGCMMQQPHVVEEIRKKFKHVDLIFGTHNLYKLPELLCETMNYKKTLIDVWDVDGEVIEGLKSNRKFSLKAFVNIVYGCNNFCTYCIVPYTRGRERSRELNDILNEVKELVANGTKEITFLGQNVNSYGKTLENPVSFATLLRKANEIEGLERIRFMTSHPKDISDEVIYAVRDCDKVCEFLHLPIQCGSTKLLKAMNRHYTKESYLQIIEKARKEIPEVAFSTDLMIGFPGEDDSDILDTIDVIEKVRYDCAFTFIYSKRSGTPAAEMTNQIPEEIKHERFNKVLKSINRICGEINSKYLNKEVEVLVEGFSKKNKKILTGRTRQNKTVNFTGGNENIIGSLVKVKIIEPKSFSLNGKLI